MAQREKWIQVEITRLLRSLGWDVCTLGTRRRKGDYQGTMMTPGIPDLYAFPPNALRGHRELWIEVKAPNGRMSPAQIHFEACCLRNGIPHVVGGTDEVLSWLVKNGYLRADQVSAERKLG